MSDGADPSCGARDTSTWKLCMGGQKSNDIKYSEGYEYLMDNHGGSDVCNNCGPNGDGSCDGRVKLVNPDGEGRVACLAHGTYGGNQGNMKTTCSTGHYGSATKETFDARVNRFNMMIDKCGQDDSGYTEKVSIL